MPSMTIFILMIVSGTSTSLSSRERRAAVSAKSDFDFLSGANELNIGETSRIKLEEVATSAEEEIISKLASSSEDTKGSSRLKGRKHKAFFLDYPLMSRPTRQKPQKASPKDLSGYEPEARKKNKKRYQQQQESQIYYIKLPATPYTFVPGFGYISQPPTYSSPGIHRPGSQRPSRPQLSYQKPPSLVGDPFIKLPVDFVSNGKPTGVYQWPAKRRESALNRLNEGPYSFNGRPTSIYLLNSKGHKTGHQPIRLTDSASNNLYYSYNEQRR